MAQPAPVVKPPLLQEGDTIAIICPAKKLPRPIRPAIKLLESWGLKVTLGETVYSSYHQFAGDDALRAKDLQRFIADDTIRAVIAARGGYGTVRIIDRVDFSHLSVDPKWIIGFSDITILHTHIFTNYNLQTIHGQMPIDMPDATLPSLHSLRNALFGDNLVYPIPYNFLNRAGDATGILVGGNLSLLIAVAGSVSDLDYTNKILFIEDVGEYLYAIDRMMHMLKRSGKLSKLSGLIAGGFSNIKDNDTPFGETAQEIILSAVADYDYPVCFDFPAGHIQNNYSLVLGSTIKLQVSETAVSLTYL